MSTSVGEIEERSVGLAELKVGVQLSAGHPVVLIVNGAKGRKIPDPVVTSDETKRVPTNKRPAP